MAFLRLCCIYWNAECEMTVEHAELECDGHFDRLVALKMVEVIGDKIGIKFLNIQYEEGREKRQKMSNAGKASAERKFNERSTNVQQTFNECSIEKSREEKSKIREDIRVDKKESKGAYTRENFIDDLLGEYKTDTDLRSVTKTWLQKKKVITEKSMQISKAEIQGHNKSEMYAAIMAAADKGWAQLYSRKAKTGQTNQGKSTALPVGKPSLDPQTIADAKASAERLAKLESRSEGVTEF